MYRSSKPNCNAVVPFLDKSGFKNPYTHLKSCDIKGLDQQGQEKAILKLYTDAENESVLEGSSILKQFKLLHSRTIIKLLMRTSDLLF